MLVALAGLVAMHGMSEHGVTHPDSSAMSAMTTGVMVGGLEGAADVVGFVEDGEPAVVAIGGTAADLVGKGADAAMVLCMAILAGLVLLLTRGHGLWAGLFVRPVAPGVDARIARTARDPDPPDLFALCILRC